MEEPKKIQNSVNDSETGEDLGETVRNNSVEDVSKLEKQLSLLKFENKETQAVMNESDEDVFRLQKQLSMLKLENIETLKDKREQGKETFGLLMRAGFRRESDEHAKFQPCEDDLKFLRRLDPALCKALYDGTLVDFCCILYPNDDILDQKVGVHVDVDSRNTEFMNSIFHLHGNRNKDDSKEFDDLMVRAKKLAIEINSISTEIIKVNIDLLDGHGRMLVCLIKAVMDTGLKPDEMLNFRVFEIDENAYQYHRYVFPHSVKNIDKSILDESFSPENKSIIYLNFCSVPSMTDDEAWKIHFACQTSDYWVPHCCKENVLKYIWRVTHPPSCCTVMVSLVIKHVKTEDGVYHRQYKSTLGDYINGLGFLHLLRRVDLFNAEIVSIRDEGDIEWYDNDKRKPKKLRSGSRGAPFVTLLIRPKESNTEEEINKLSGVFEDEWGVADLREDIQKGSRVKIIKGKHKDKGGIVKARTPAMFEIDNGIGHVRNGLCKLVENI